MLRTDFSRAEPLLDAYLRRTGVRGGAGDPSRRYLWTDAFAVVTLLAIARARGARAPIDDAIRLATLVHRTLGRHRKDDLRIGWISGLGEAEGELCPTAGGLRIGKPLRERTASEPFDEFLEWERDGQYFHYLTRWMDALSALSEATGDRAWNHMAVDLAHAACAAFIHSPRVGAAPRMYWKMSIDLTRPLVKSMGLLDPLDGFTAVARVRACGRRLAHDEGGASAGLAPDDPHGTSAGRSTGLSIELERLHAMLGEPAAWATTDALGIGGLLHAASEQIDLIASGDLPFDAKLHDLLAATHRSLDFFVSSECFSRPLPMRLAFRELGLALGVQAIEPMLECVMRDSHRFGEPGDLAALSARLDAMSKFALLAQHVEETWLAPAAQETRGWTEHLDINEVMLAASLAGAVRAMPAPSARRS